MKKNTKRALICSLWLCLLALMACGEATDLTGVEASLKAAEERDTKMAAQIDALQNKAAPSIALPPEIAAKLDSIAGRLKAIEDSANAEDDSNEDEKLESIESELRKLRISLDNLESGAMRPSDPEMPEEPSAKLTIKEEVRSDPMTTELSEGRSLTFVMIYDMDFSTESHVSSKEDFLKLLFEENKATVNHMLSNKAAEDVLSTLPRITSGIHDNLYRGLSWNGTVRKLEIDIEIKELKTADGQVLIKDGEVTPELAKIKAAREAALKKAQEEAEAEEKRRREMYGVKGSVKLPFEASDVLVIDKGTLAVIKFANQALLGIVDLKEMKLLGTVKTFEADQVFAAGGTTIFMVGKANGVARLVNARTRKTIKTKANPIEGTIQSAVMGSDNDQRVFLRVARSTDSLGHVRYEALDLNTFEVIKIEGRPHNSSFRDDERMTMSPDGSILTASCHSHSPSGQIIGRLYDTGKLDIHYEHDSVGRIYPLGNSGNAVTGSGRVIDENGKTIKQHRNTSGLVSDYMGQFYVATGRQQQHWRYREERPSQTSGSFPVYAASNNVKLTNLELIYPEGGVSDQWAMPVWQQNRIYMLGARKKSLLSFAFDPMERMKELGIDYLFLKEAAPTSAAPGETLSFTPEFYTNKEKLTVSMLDGPEGSGVKDSKTFTWKVPADFSEAVTIILSVTSADESVEEFITFKVAPKE